MPKSYPTLLPDFGNTSESVQSVVTNSHQSPHLSLFIVTVLTFPFQSLDLWNPYHFPLSLILFPSNLYPDCFSV